MDRVFAFLTELYGPLFCLSFVNQTVQFKSSPNKYPRTARHPSWILTASKMQVFFCERNFISPHFHSETIFPNVRNSFCVFYRHRKIFFASKYSDGFHDFISKKFPPTRVFKMHRASPPVLLVSRSSPTRAPWGAPSSVCSPRPIPVGHHCRLDQQMDRWIRKTVYCYIPQNIRFCQIVF